MEKKKFWLKILRWGTAIFLFLGMLVMFLWVFSGEDGELICGTILMVIGFGGVFSLGVIPALSKNKERETSNE